MHWLDCSLNLKKNKKKNVVRISSWSSLSLCYITNDIIDASTPTAFLWRVLLWKRGEVKKASETPQWTRPQAKQTFHVHTKHWQKMAFRNMEIFFLHLQTFCVVMWCSALCWFIHSTENIRFYIFREFSSVAKDAVFTLAVPNIGVCG